MRFPHQTFWRCCGAAFHDGCFGRGNQARQDRIAAESNGKQQGRKELLHSVLPDDESKKAANAAIKMKFLHPEFLLTLAL
jgi:hypothetical protein